MTKEELIKKAMTEDGVLLGSDGSARYVVVKLTEENIDFKDNETFKEQAKYLINNSYINLFIPADLKKPYPFHWLPVFGDKDKYVLKYFSSNPESLVKSDLMSRQIALLKRANEYEEYHKVR